MPRSRLEPHRSAIMEALDAGTSVRNLARTYGVHHSTMQYFIGKRAADGRRDPLHACQYQTLRYARNQAARSQHRSTEAWL